jgi:preprotein translocase subunit SecF
MKKIIKFSRFFLPLVTLSTVLILSGVVALLTRGINFGIDFQPGLIQQVRIAPAAFSMSYKGSATISVEMDSTSLTLVISGAAADNRTITFLFADYPDVASLVTALNTIDGVSATVRGNSAAATTGLFADASVSTVLSSDSYILHYSDSAVLDARIDDVRNALSALDGVSIKEIGTDSERAFQIRMADKGDNTSNSKTMQDTIKSVLRDVFGTDNVAVIKTDYIGSQFSKSLVSQVVLMVAATLLLIWLYATIRFKWDFALGAVLAVIHDALIMVAFVTWTQMEFTSTTVAAILTIIGYSINDTVVVLDRVRENMRILKVKSFKDILDISQTEILSRTVITTVTTLLAVIALFVFTSGSMRDFAGALIVGMISGVYSTIFIAGAFIALVRKNWKPSDEKNATAQLTVYEN